MIEELRSKVKALLKNKQVDMVIGYQRAADGISATPCFIVDENEADKLIWDAYCVYNLANYLKEFRGKKIALTVKPCDARSLIMLLQENQLKREDVFIIGVECHGVINEKRVSIPGKPGQEIGFDEKCRSCASCVPAFYDLLIKEKKEKIKLSDPAEKDKYEPIRKLEAKSLDER